MAQGTVTSKGQVTIPKEIRKKLAIREGDRLAFTVSDNGKVALEVDREDRLSRVFGMLGHLRRRHPVSVRQMSRAVKRRARNTLRRGGASR